MIALIEVLILAFGGFAVGKGIYKIVIMLLQRITKKTSTKLDDIILRYVEKPLELFSVFFFIYFLSGFLENLGYFRKVISDYSYAIVILLAAYLISEIIGGLLRWYYEVGKEKTKLIKFDVTLLPFVRKVSTIIIMFFALLSAFSVIGFDISGIVTITSVVMLVLGLASQETLGNIFAGIALQLDRPFNYGDFLRLTTGEVVVLKKIGLRSSKLDDLNGNTMIFSNSELAKQRIINLSRPGESFKSTVNVDVPTTINLEKFKEYVTKKIEEANPEMKESKTISFSIEKVSPSITTIAITFWVKEYPRLSQVKNAANQAALEFIKKNKE